MGDLSMTKEEVYDREIAPLMSQIIGVCKREKISLVADFGLDGDLHCTTALTKEEFLPSPEQLKAVSLLIAPPGPTLLMITKKV